MILAVLAVLSLPLLRAARHHVGDDGSLNLSVYKQQLQELEADHERGLVTGDQLEQARTDIERALLSEVPETGTVTRTGDRQHGWLPTLLVAVSVVAVSLPLYLAIGHPGVLDGRPGAAPAAGHGDGRMPSVQEMVTSLEQRLERNPDDAQGWLMLARSYTVLGRHEDAVRVLERLRGMVGDEPGLLVRYANALAMTNDGRFRGRPEELIRRVLQQNPDHPSALWFAGLAADQRGDYREAVDYWERLVPKLAGEDQALARLQNMIARARAAIGTGGETAAGGRTEAPAAGVDQGSEPAAAEAGVTVRVSLAPDLQERVQPDDALFIFARAPSGPPMPLAAVRRRAGDLPLEVRLDDSDAMTSAARISGHDAVTLVARVSRSGQPQAASGDLQGRMTGVAIPAAEPVQLIIDTPVP